ncbi:MAG: WecB/TagA/CpsF family glycosyltransferase [Desulfamplus sp.]|nr:WecB/TagA/CpsF family glycosyltransferase [Desulfamplus sp.]
MINIDTSLTQYNKNKCTKNQIQKFRTGSRILGVFIDALEWEEAITSLMAWGRINQSRYVVICNVHVTVSASRDNQFGNVVRGANMVTPDGAPVAWMLRRSGYPNQQRISGPDLFWKVCQRCVLEGISIYLYGSTETTLAALTERLNSKFPALKIAGVESPPFRPLTKEEAQAAVDRINGSGAGFVFVGLGCPKQENWMAAHCGRINAVMIGVGAAFDFHAGITKRAPLWMQAYGLEWLHRFISEPRRLWRRYLVTNTWFIISAIRQLVIKNRV